MPAKLHPMTRRDKPALMKILENTPEFTPPEVVVAEEVIDCYLDNPDGSGYYILVAEIDLGIVGYICYGPTPLTEGTWDIYWLAVAPAQQGQGIGMTLVRDAEKKIKAARGRQIMIETSSKPNYEKTRRFHQRQGYEVICQVPDFYAPGDSKVIYMKRP